MSMIKLWCPLLVLLFAASACHKAPPATAPIRTTPAPSAVPARPPAPSPPPPAAAASPAPARLTEAELFQRKSLDELNAEHPLGDVFFDYEQNTLRDDATRILQKDAQWLSKWPQTIIRVDGHCDERGTAEYNLALGDRRAVTVREYLSSLGIRPERIQTRSLGKEAPFCERSGEACWSQNRRGHFVITGK
jgi:peptidoglycan-associated lipoprotein